MPFHIHVQQLLALQQQARSTQHRVAVVLEGERQWQSQVLQSLGALHQYHNGILLTARDPYEGDRDKLDLPFTQSLTFKQARQKLGQESDIIIADLNAPFDANGFTAICGTLKGGALLIVLPRTLPNSTSDLWLQTAFQSFHQIQQHGPCGLFDAAKFEGHNIDPFTEQRQAIEAVQKVLTGHRKRPLVITADRGRGKSTALGIAAAQIISHTDKTLLVTAPSTQAVKTLFEHARQQLHLPAQQGYVITSETGGCLRFIAPDELLNEQPHCDLLLVDEAAAIPLPLLQGMVERYHRACFATTVHGYEGCGRGFSIKFSPWLNQHRPGWQSLQLTQPIRWNRGDPLEAWLFDTFLLNAEVEPVTLPPLTSLQLEKLQLDNIERPSPALRQAFGLLVTAHYQTSPNDLFQLLDDPKAALYQVVQDQRVIGVVLGYLEGGLAESLLDDIQLGRRRPAGHLVPVSLTHHLADNRPAVEPSLRVMRIAVHPDCQGQGIGHLMLEQLCQRLHKQVAYISTCFGVTEQLLHFWLSNSFSSVRLGAKQDQASGCFSLTMIKTLGAKESHQHWSKQAKVQLIDTLIDTASDAHQPLVTPVLLALLQPRATVSLCDEQRLYRLVSNYTLGGASFEGTRIWVQQLLLRHIKHVDLSKVNLIADLCIKKQTWATICRSYGFTGRKQAESHYKTLIIEHLLHR
ncbi:GNAT family N-acetyltransferase [Vibrio rarus]|uniref:GNAT family N-acetyltransferase n=1 Tax=Vibrio rarus TaxID=413403 RepID=UPI0021C341BB|nr:GNAT family N-acetyltransferase [Vibrio rarus]